MRERYRNTTPRVCLARYKLVTDFYMHNMQLTGILKRAKNLRNLFEKIPVLVNDDELIVGSRSRPIVPVHSTRRSIFPGWWMS